MIHENDICYVTLEMILRNYTLMQITSILWIHSSSFLLVHPSFRTEFLYKLFTDTVVPFIKLLLTPSVDYPLQNELLKFLKKSIFESFSFELDKNDH